MLYRLSVFRIKNLTKCTLRDVMRERSVEGRKSIATLSSTLWCKRIRINSAYTILLSTVFFFLASFSQWSTCLVVDHQFFSSTLRRLVSKRYSASQSEKCSPVYFEKSKIEMKLLLIVFQINIQVCSCVA